MASMGFAKVMAESLGITAASVMTDCEKFGMCYGCRKDCPQFEREECEIYKNIDDFLRKEA